MKLAEFFIRIVARGGDQTAAELKKVDKASKDTAGALGLLEEAVNDVQIGGKGLIDIYKGVGSNIARMTPTVAASTGAIGGAVLAVGALTAALGAVTVASYGFLLNSRQAGIEFEAMKKRLEGLAGSAKRADEILALARFEAGPSMFTTQQLEQASVMLVAFGLNVERVLPLVTRLGQAFGADQEHLMMYARAFGQMASGRLPEAEVMAQMGVSKTDLGREGIKFDSQGSLLSSTEETMAAFEHIIMTKYDGAYQASTTTTDAMVASITDSFQEINRVVGETTNTGLKPFISTFGEMVSKIAGSALPEMFASDLLRPLELLTGSAKDAVMTFQVLAASVLAFANIVPNAMMIVADAIKKIQHGTLLEKAEGILSLKPGAIAAKLGKLAVEDTKRYYYAMQVPRDTGGINTANKTKPFVVGGGAPKPEDDTKEKKHKKAVEHHLERISNNTRKSADLLDLRNQTIGGGRLGALGLTGPELATTNSRIHTDLSRARPMSADSMVTRGIKLMIQNGMGFAVNGGRTVPVR
jgi:hypothetical protein